MNVSIGLSQGIMLGRLIGNIRVYMTKEGCAKITNESHHLVTPELLARMWRIGLEKAKETLKKTTKDYILSSIIPPTGRYRIYLVSQRLRRILCTLYMDTLFEKQKSVIGKTCAQICTDRRGFVYVHLMLYK